MDPLPTELAELLQQQTPPGTPFAECEYWYQVSHVFGSSVTYAGDKVYLIGLVGSLTDESGVDAEYPIVLALDSEHAKSALDMLTLMIEHEETGRPWLIAVDDPSEED